MGFAPFKLPLVNDLILGEPVWITLILDLNKTYVREVTKPLIPIYAIADYELIGNGETQIVNSNWNLSPRRLISQGTKL